MTYLQLINDHYSDFTKSEKKIADLFLTQREKMISWTMNDIKEAVKVGDATIIRFCQKLGYSGFTDFKIAIARSDFSSVEDVTNESHFSTRVYQKIQQTIEETQVIVDKNQLDQAIELILSAENVLIYGVGHSGVAAEDLASMFMRIGILAKAYSDSHFQNHASTLLNEKDVVIALSLTGRTKDIVDAITIARENQAQIIAITNFPSSPVGQLADQVLQTSAEEFINGGSIYGRMTQLYICGLLVEGVSMKSEQNILDIREKALRSILNKRLD